MTDNPLDKDIIKARNAIIKLSNDLRVTLFQAMRWSDEQEGGDVVIHANQHEVLKEAWQSLKCAFDTLDRAQMAKDTQRVIDERIWAKPPVKDYTPDFYDKTHEHGFDEEGNEIVVCTAYEDEVTDREVKKIFG